MRPFRSLTAALVLVTAIGCSGDEGDEDEFGGVPPTLMLEADRTDIVSGETITLTVHVENFMLSGEAGHDHDHAALELDFDPPLSNDMPDPFAAEAGAYDGAREGHVHVYLDDLMTNPLVMLTTATGEVVIDADAGTHTLIGRLHSTDHLIIEPQIIDEVELTVN